MKKTLSQKGNQQRTRVKQVDVPSVGLDQALRVPAAIAEQYASQPTKPLNVATALNMQPTSGPFRSLCGASIAYGLTNGGYNADHIELTDLARRIVRPVEEGGEIVARREALLRPRVLGQFLTKYDGSPMPKQGIAINVLEDMGVPRERTQKTLDLVTTSARDLGLLSNIKGRDYVNLTGVTAANGASTEDVQSGVSSNGSAVVTEFEEPPTEGGKDLGASGQRSPLEGRKKRVFIAHGKNTSVLPIIKKLLKYGELEPVVSGEQSTVSQPIPDKVLGDMRSSGAAIIHVDAERVIHDGDAGDHFLLNENVLIEIGASMALYGRRFILLVKDGIALPSNLQGLYEVRYEGMNLDGAATLKLLDAINDIKTKPLPEEA